MAKNIEINILNSSGSYETLYPTTDYNNLLNKPTIPTVPSLPLSIANGGTAGNSAANAVYNLLQGLSSRTASNVNSYASSTYLGCYYGSTGYKVPISNLMTYINNNISGGNCQTGYAIGTGSPLTITTSFTRCYLMIISCTNTSKDITMSEGKISVNTGLIMCFPYYEYNTSEKCFALVGSTQNASLNTGYDDGSITSKINSCTISNMSVYNIGAYFTVNGARNKWVAFGD